MRFYAQEDSPHWYPTLMAAHEATRDCEDAVYRPSVRICEYEVSTDKESILALLHGSRAYCFKTGRVWTLTQRGGLREIVTNAGEATL